MTDALQLQGRVFVQFALHTVTGLHIGGSETGVEIGGVDKTVIRNPISNEPYIPGSSLRGKMRSLTEKHLGLALLPLGGRREDASEENKSPRVHQCGKGQGEAYKSCRICRVYGVAANVDYLNTPTRLIVRDVFMEPESAIPLKEKAQTDLPFTEVKTEVAIDRVTSVATPRQMERVPAGVVFGPAQLIYSVYQGQGCDPAEDVTMLDTVFLGLKLLEDDYLGGLGSRGSGQVRAERLRIGYKAQRDYGAEPTWLTPEPLANLAELERQQADLLAALRAALCGG